MITGTHTMIYVDGFNLYYGALKGTAYKWLNFEALFARVFSQQQDCRYPVLHRSNQCASLRPGSTVAAATLFPCAPDAFLGVDHRGPLSLSSQVHVAGQSTSRW